MFSNISVEKHNRERHDIESGQAQEEGNYRNSITIYSDYSICSVLRVFRDNK
jgi:hypothetical protein